MGTPNVIKYVRFLIFCYDNFDYFFQPNAQYQFSFDISDDESTNYHNRKEQRDGEKISGSYSVVDSDGYIRTVTYTADPEEVLFSNNNNNMMTRLQNFYVVDYKKKKKI